MRRGAVRRREAGHETVPFEVCAQCGGAGIVARETVPLATGEWVHRECHPALLKRRTGAAMIEGDVF